MFDLKTVVAAVERVHGEELADAVGCCDVAERLVEVVFRLSQAHDLTIDEVLESADLEEDEAAWAVSADHPAAVLIRRIRDGLE